MLLLYFLHNCLNDASKQKSSYDTECATTLVHTKVIDNIQFEQAAASLVALKISKVTGLNIT